MHLRSSFLAAALLAAPALARAGDAATRPPHFIRGPILRAAYDGLANDLLTGGLGASGLQAATAPPFADPLHPTAVELRTRAIYNNYRALVDMTTAGGYGVLYGPNVDVNGQSTLGEGKIAGEEFLAYADDGTGRVNVTLMVQVPASFDRRRACIVTGTSSGSRGVYGAMATAGEWGLKHGCAVAYTDKGTGNGAHDLQANTVSLIDGVRADAAVAGVASNFTAPLSAADLADFSAAHPDRFAFKHAHSQLNPEKDWGKNTLQAIRFAFYVLNALVPGNEGDEGEGEGHRLSRHNTIVIASSVSNGGGAALAAAEEDRHGLISGVVAGEPQVQVRVEDGLAIQRGSTPVATFGRPLLDVFTVANLFQPCASRSAALAASPGLAFVNATLATNRCAALAAAGLLHGTTLSDQADEALALLHAFGYEPDSDVLHASLYAFATPAIAVTYANSYGRFPVTRGLCGFSFAATGLTGVPIPIAPAGVAQIFASGNGIPPTGGANIVNDLSAGGPLLDGASISPGGVRDLNAPGALCLRSLVTGADASGAPLQGAPEEDHERVEAGIAEVLRTGDLHGKPALIVHGRDDGLVPVNHASRAYFGMNRIEEGKRSRLSYLEVENAQHFDSFIGSPLLTGYATRFVPLHKYFLEAMDLMFAHLTSGARLPASQVVRTVPRGGTPGAAPPIGPANVPPIPLEPAPGDRITFSSRTVLVPD